MSTLTLHHVVKARHLSTRSINDAFSAEVQVHDVWAELSTSFDDPELTLM
jgi:hypothetical protein